MEMRRVPMTRQNTDKAQAQMDGKLPGPDVMLRLWASWMDQMSAPTQALADPGTTWWQMTTDNPVSSFIGGGVNQFQRSLSQDPTLRSIDQM
jgi:polyhydroxyalkanoate synthase